ncbi:MAG: PIN domain-containing protein [Microgenomates group bacterium]
MSSKVNYLIIFDTNALFGDPIRSSVLNFIDTYSKNTRFVLTFAIPEIVKKELTKHTLKKFEKALHQYQESAKEIEFLTNHKFRDLHLDQKAALNRLNRLFKKKNIKILPTPYKKINWEAIVDKAVEYIPPFEEGKEKGFKDSLIIETILSHMKKLDKDTYVAFIFIDNVLNEFIKTLTQTHKQLHVYQSTDDFETYLKLQLLDSDKEFIEKIKAEAEFTFSDETNPNALFWKENLRTKIYSTYREIIENPYYANKKALLGATTYGETLVPIDSGRYTIANPTFIERDENSILTWRSSVIFERAYWRSNYIPIHTHISERSHIAQHSHAPQTTPEVMYYNVEFEVIWKCQMNEEEKITDAMIDNIKFINNWRNERDSYTNLYFDRSANTSLPTTTSGQGTIPISSLNDIINDKSY